jgi:hypothetical protein
MGKRTIVAMPGDGIGKIVLEQCIRLLNAAGFDAEYVHGDIGWEFWCKEGNPLPDRTIALLEKYKIGLFGAITSKPKDKAKSELDPALQNQELVYYSPIVTMRQRFKMDICMRPCKTIKGNPLNFIRRTADGGFEEPLIDAMIFRQKEGKILETEFELHITGILTLLKEVEPFESERIQSVKSRLMKSFHEYSDQMANFDTNRFEQELIFYLEKLDFTEEKVRLAQHCQYFIETMRENNSNGKKLAFICQEIGREINTLGSKSLDANIQKRVVQMKDALEKIKEQLANIL